MQLLATHQTSEQIFSKNFGWRRDTFVLEHVKEEILFLSRHTQKIGEAQWKVQAWAGLCSLTVEMNGSEMNGRCRNTDAFGAALCTKGRSGQGLNFIKMAGREITSLISSHHQVVWIVFPAPKWEAADV